MTPPIPTVSSPHPQPSSPADRLLIEERLGRRQMLRRGLITLLVVAGTTMVLGLLFPIGRQLSTAWWLERLGCRVDWQIDATNWRQGGGTFVTASRRFGSSIFGADLGDDDLHYLLNLHRVQSLALSECEKITDQGLAMLRGLDLLTELDLARLNRYRHPQYFSEAKTLTDACLVHLRSLPQLESLALSGNSITDRGLAQLAELSNLKVLDLDATEVSDAGLIHLQGMQNLQEVNLAATRVTAAGVQKLKAARPDLTIITDTDPAVEQAVKQRRGRMP